MPMPVSSTKKAKPVLPSVRGRETMVSVTPPWSVNFSALFTQVEQNLLQAGGVSQHPGRQLCLHHDGELQLLFHRQWVHQRVYLVQQGWQLHWFGVQRHLA